MGLGILRHTSIRKRRMSATPDNDHHGDNAHDQFHDHGHSHEHGHGGPCSAPHGPLSLEKLKTYESFQFDEAWTEARRKMYLKLDAHTKRIIYVLRFLLDLGIGYIIGLLAFFIHWLTHTMSDARVSLTLAAPDRGAAWLTNTGFMLAFLVPALLGVLWQPGAGSSGVPGVIAFLNGCNIPNALTPKVWAVKVLGLCCSVASGLPAGSEGPMAQIGAMTALMLIEYTARPLFRGYAQWLDDDATDCDERDYTALGAGCGVAAAFKSPISATVLIIEEISSFFNKAHATHVFVACVFAYHMVSMLGAATGETASAVFQLSAPYAHCTSFLRNSCPAAAQFSDSAARLAGTPTARRS